MPGSAGLSLQATIELQLDVMIPLSGCGGASAAARTANSSNTQVGERAANAVLEGLFRSTLAAHQPPAAVVVTADSDELAHAAAEWLVRCARFTRVTRAAIVAPASRIIGADGVERTVAHGIDLVIVCADDTTQWQLTRELLQDTPTRAVLIHAANETALTAALASLESDISTNEWAPVIGLEDLGPAELRQNRRFFEQIASTNRPQIR